MKNLLLGTLVLGLLGASSQSALAQDIVGSWKANAFYQKVLATGEKRFPFGEKIVGRVVYSKEGTYCTMTTAADRKQAGPAPTDQERVELFKTMYAYCGRYKVNDSNISGERDVAWTPGWLKGDLGATIKIDGNKLLQESKPFKSQLDGVEVVAVLEYERE